MTYPTSEDYLRAVQQPERVFRVPALQHAKFAVHPVFGIPMPASGNAAVVFKAKVNGADQALRFFIRDDASTSDRYAALGDHFSVHGLNDCVAQATWIDGAITVKQATWPVIEMQWVEGRTLDKYIEHLAESNNGSALYSLAMAWRDVVDRLQQAEFAHGDLQHGNVLIDTQSALRLVDFDGSWIEAFNGGPPPTETGHPNYQRTGREWGRWMDTFPGLVIYTSLLVLSRRPDLWRMLHDGENMLFSHNDYAPPFRTPTWQTVSEIGDQSVVDAVALLRECCSPTWRAADTLKSLLHPVVHIAATPTWEPVPVAGQDSSAPWWVLTAASSTTAAAPAGIQSQPAALPPPPPIAGERVTGAEVPIFRGARPSSGWYASPSGPYPARPAPPPNRPHPAPAPPRPQARPRGLSRGLATVLAIIIGFVAALVSYSLFYELSGVGAMFIGTIAGAVARRLLLRSRSRRGP